VRPKVSKHWFPRERTATEPRIPRRWKLFIALSTATFLVLAGGIALCWPAYRPVAWALVVFSACHASFLLVQRVGCEPADLPEGMQKTAAYSGDSAPLP
jgi:hypothetical protein